MPMTVASPQSATPPESTHQRASLGCLRPQPASRAALSIFPSHTPQRSTGPRPVTLMVFNGQQIPSPKVPLLSAKVHPKERRPATPQVYHPVKFHRPASTHTRYMISLIKILQTQTETVNDISPTVYRHCEDKNIFVY